jgi:hypothetical protein
MGTLALFLGLAIIALGIIGFVVPLRARKADRKDRTDALQAAEKLIFTVNISESLRERTGIGPGTLFCFSAAC